MIKVLLFADLEEKAGVREIELSNSEMKVLEVKKYLIEEYPVLKGIENALPAVNEEYATSDTVVKSGDTIAFIPPVSGG
ncbi:MULTISPECIES: molybdopterin converting factor subunit 1 [Bacillaceae]|uniref:Molybdopterin synthase sulfur carrier subunit n=1 Tax=Evansella alkalicola TaxID=745819 RepID=A0ABS6JTD5_9BACI|nr:MULTISPECIES: molybdopterin converting factor subunit 1 [Bacillaceae]MBU9721821.1 molybdopterin converting factor subunit 1 [Bacillus alkalicola]